MVDRRPTEVYRRTKSNKNPMNLITPITPIEF